MKATPPPRRKITPAPLGWLEPTRHVSEARLTLEGKPWPLRTEALGCGPQPGHPFNLSQTRVYFVFSDFLKDFCY